MLQKLVIKNIALIDSAEINFTKGLNVLSGETGAGKSVIIESLNFVLGAKADKTLIRSGQTECRVDAEFDVASNSVIKDVFLELDFDDDDILLITRKFNLDGKSTIKINGNTATVSMLKKFTAALVDVHGQSEHFNLLKTSNQLDLIDKVGGDAVLTQKNIIKSLYSDYKNIVSELETLGGDERDRLIKLDVLNYQINEISNSNLAENEEEELTAIKQKLQHQEKILSTLSALKSAINDEGGISDVISGVSRAVYTISDFGHEYQELYDRLESAFSDIDDIAAKAGNLCDDFDVEQVDPNEIDSRLKLVKAIKSKYGPEYIDVVNFLNHAENEREKLENLTEIAEEKQKQKEKIKKQLYAEYIKLSETRKNVCDRFCSSVLTELRELGMTKAQFLVSFGEFPTYEECKFNSSNGFDNLEFLFSANSGEPVKPLSSIISGGEMSRFMLSIKAQTAKVNDISTFIFDEIDSGISGNVAKVVSEKFARIAKDVQIIAISHLPQISVMADNNLLIQKNEVDGKTITTVSTLNKAEKINEIVRLIGGSISSESAISHAKTLISEAEIYKKALM